MVSVQGTAPGALGRATCRPALYRGFGEFSHASLGCLASDGSGSHLPWIDGRGCHVARAWRRTGTGHESLPDRPVVAGSGPIWVKCGMSWLYATLDQAGRSGRLHALGISQSDREITMARRLALNKD